MNEQSIKVILAGSEFSVKVNQSETEIVIDAARLINDKIAELNRIYSVNDKKDALSMMSLLLVSQHLRKIKDQDAEIKKLQSVLGELQEMVKNHQSKINQ